MKKYVFIIVIIFSIPVFATESRFDSLLNAGVHQIYSLKFKDAEKTFGVVAKDYPRHPAGKFFDAMIWWWKIMLDFDNEEYDEIFTDKLENVIEMCDNILDKDPKNVDAIFFKGGSLGFRGRLYSVRQSWFNAALDGKDALPLVFKAYELDPKNKDIQLGFGIYNYYASVIPKKFPFVKPFMVFFPPGNREKGLAQLEDAALNGRYASIEATFILLNLIVNFEDDIRPAEKHAARLVKEFPDNPAFQRYYGKFWVKMGNYEKASEIFRTILQKCENKKTGFNNWVKREALYYLGMDRKNADDFKTARHYLLECENLSKKMEEDKESQSGFLVNTTLFLAEMDFDEGRLKEAEQRFKAVLDYDEYKESYKTANEYLQKIKKAKRS